MTECGSKPFYMKPIKDFLGNGTNFFIPSYQRGYKWKTVQVKDLLNDIKEFHDFTESTKNEDNFYCLQPLVVKKDPDDKNLRILDGQQRITTLYLILKFLGKNELYAIEYETRKNSKNFLDRIDDGVDTESVNNPDYVYMSNAYKVIKEWFKEKDPSLQTDEGFYKTLTERVKFIYYEVNEKDENAIFARLNIGKIPLTNAEIIKAMFILDAKNNQKNPILLSTQWDHMETKLQDDKFFSFLFKNSKDQPTRIDFILDMVANDLEDKLPDELRNLYQNDERKTYYIFHWYFNNKTDDLKTDDLWKRVKTYFRIFNELYDDQKYYHLVGYLISTDTNKINEIISEFKNKEHSKADFLEIIKGRIKDKFTNTSIQELKYNESKEINDKIKEILFLFNVISTMNTKNTRYRFDLHNASYGWSLEHISPQSPRNKASKSDIKSLLYDYRGYAKGIKDKEKSDLLNEGIKKICKELKNMSGELTKDSPIHELFENLLKTLDLHNISNLALLRKKDNSSLSNKPFYQKAKRIIELYENKKNLDFIPPCTLNVFLKYYTVKNDSEDQRKQIESSIWSASDGQNYQDNIKATLAEYLPTQEDK